MAVAGTSFAASPLKGQPIGTAECFDYGKNMKSTTVNTVVNLFDGDPETFFATYEKAYTWGGLDLGQPHVITRIGWTARNIKNGERAVILGLFEGANSPDFSDAVPIAIVKDGQGDSVMNYIDVNVSRGFRYVRYVGPSGYRCQVAELEFYGEPGEGDDSRYYQLTNLPTVYVNTVNGEIPYDKEHEIPCTVTIISEDGKEVLSKSAGIRERGNASREFPKKPYRIKFEKKTSVLDAPAEAKKWTLLNNYGDKSLMRNILSFETAKMLGADYVPFCRAVDVVLNGEYKGCYQLCDQIDVRENRVDIDELTPEDNSGEALTGGYLCEIDGYADQEKVWFTTNRYFLPVSFKSPDEDDITPEQLNYIRDYFNEVERAFPSDNNPEPMGYPYRDVFDTPSFIRHMLTNEVAGNTDCYWSVYMIKRRNDPKLYTGPVWDFDLGYNNDWRVYPVTSRSGNSYLWDCGAASAAGNMRYLAQRVFLKDESTTAEILDIWREARRAGFSADWLLELIDRTAAELDESQTLNFKRWPILNEKVHMNAVAMGSYESEVEFVRSYIRGQIPHLDQVIGFDPYSDPILSGVAESAVAMVSWYVEGNLLHVDGDGEISLYTLDGRAVYNGPASTSITLPANGVYILRSGEKSWKILY